MTKPIGRSRTTVLREVINALFYLLSTGCQWRVLPKEFSPRSTMHRCFTAWREDGSWSRIHHATGIPINLYVDTVADSLLTRVPTARRSGEKIAKRCYDDPGATLEAHMAAFRMSSI